MPKLIVIPRRSWFLVALAAALALSGPACNAAAYSIRRTPTTVTAAANTSRGSAASNSSTTSSTTSADGFVTESDGQLYLNGSPYRFVGFNLTPLNNASAGYFSCGYQLSNYSQDLTNWQLSPAQAVDRIWAFQSWMTKTDGSHARTWTMLDNALAVLKAHDMRAILTLTDEWGACDHGGQKNEAWFRSGYKHRVSPGDTSTYKTFVQMLAARYANDPTVLAYELGNEIGATTYPGPTCSDTATQTMSNFANDMYSTIHAVDPNHLVLLGSTEGCGSPNDASSLDMCTWHDYAEPYVTLPRALTDQVSQCGSLGKALFVGEEGIGVGINSGINTLTDRKNAISAKLRQYFQAGIQGYLAWEWDEPQEVRDPVGYSYTNNDPLLPILAQY